MIFHEQTCYSFGNERCYWKGKIVCGRRNTVNYKIICFQLTLLFHRTRAKHFVHRLSLHLSTLHVFSQKPVLVKHSVAGIFIKPYQSQIILSVFRCPLTSVNIKCNQLYNSYPLFLLPLYIASYTKSWYREI